MFYVKTSRQALQLCVCCTAWLLSTGDISQKQTCRSCCTFSWCQWKRLNVVKDILDVDLRWLTHGFPHGHESGGGRRRMGGGGSFTRFYCVLKRRFKTITGELHSNKQVFMCLHEQPVMSSFQPLCFSCVVHAGAGGWGINPKLAASNVTLIVGLPSFVGSKVTVADLLAARDVISDFQCLPAWWWLLSCSDANHDMSQFQHLRSMSSKISVVPSFSGVVTCSETSSKFCSSVT